MTSPIHKFLFSPPPSPPLPVGIREAPTRPFSPLRSLLPPDVRSSFDMAAARSPKSPKPGQGFTLPSVSLPAIAAAGSRASAKAGLLGVTAIDVEAANLPTIRRRRISPILSPRLLKPSIPRPIIRLVAFVALVLSGIMILRSITDAFLPSVPQADVMDGTYMPPQVARPLVAAPPRTERPQEHPLPATHELLALQSFVLESNHNYLRADINVAKPIDAADILGPAVRRLGETGSAREQQWLGEVVEDHSHSVVLWYASDVVPHYAVEGVKARHGHGNRPTMISTSNRSDAHILRGVFARLGFDLDVAPVLVIGGEPIHATEAAMEELRTSGKLSTKLLNIGWRL